MIFVCVPGRGSREYPGAGPGTGPGARDPVAYAALCKQAARIRSFFTWAFLRSLFRGCHVRIRLCGQKILHNKSPVEPSIKTITCRFDVSCVNRFNSKNSFHKTNLGKGIPMSNCVKVDPSGRTVTQNGPRTGPKGWAAPLSTTPMGSPECMPQHRPQHLPANRATNL